MNELNEKNSELEQQISLLSANRDALAVQISETKRKNSSMSITQKSIQTAIAQLKKDEIIEIEITKDSLEILRQRRTQFDEMAQKIAADPGKVDFGKIPFSDVLNACLIFPPFRISIETREAVRKGI